MKKYVYRIGAHFVLHTKEYAPKKCIISVPSLLLWYCTRLVPSEVAIYVISGLVVDWGAQGDMGWDMTSLIFPLPFRCVPSRFSRTKNQSFRYKLKQWNWSKLHKKYDHFKNSLRVNKKNILVEYSSFFKSSTWNCLHLDRINLYRSDRVQVCLCTWGVCQIYL